jgi:acyl-coenzyme A synthetase/AMP-(fatty) acid ligase
MADTTIIYIDREGRRRNLSLEALKSELRIRAKREATFEAKTKPELFALLHKAVETGIVPVLFDPKMEVIARKVRSLGIGGYEEGKSGSELPEESYALFFTSGTTGVPTGALKSRDNIESELDTLAGLFGEEGYERVIVTVPFIHIYGFLSGVMLPVRLGCEVLFKEEYWPQELLGLHESKKSLVVTSPVYIKSLLKLRREEDLSNVTFLSSTGLLLEEEVEAFEKKYNTRLVQLFGSTETGGIAFKQGATPWWTPLADVEVSQNSDGVMVVSSPHLSPYLFEETLRPMTQPFTTSDIIEKEGERFRLAGRLSEIVKISGKRIAIPEIEHLIEKELDVKEALIRLERDSSRLKDERLMIEVVSDSKPEDADVTALLKKYYPGINFEFELRRVESIEKNAMGKKVRR